jgi:hypothetical protein
MMIAVDVDGTLFDGTGVAPAAMRALRNARDDGHMLVIVTGRQWDGLREVVPEVLGLFHRVVCEEGGVLVDVTSGEICLLADPVEDVLVAGLRAAGVPDLDVGRVVVGAPFAWLDTVTAVRDRVGSTRHVVVNKSSVALAPAGCDKASGLRAAIAVLDAHALPVLAIGDAANDLPMFAMATFAAAVANADEAVRAAGIPLMHGVAGVGVAEALGLHLSPDGPPPTRR